MEKTKLNDLAPSEQLELESILDAHAKGYANAPDKDLYRRFHSTFNDAFAWWLLLLLASLGGAVGWLMNWRISEMLECFRRFPMMLRNPSSLIWLPTHIQLWGLPVSLAVAAWIALIIARNYKRRGCAATSFALMRVRGNKLAMVRHADVVAITWAHSGSKGKTFSVLDLKPATGDPKPLRLYATTTWVEVALEQLMQARAAAALPEITPTVTWGVYYRKVEQT